MASRFWFMGAAPDISPAFSASWEQTGEASRGSLIGRVRDRSSATAGPTASVTVPITTTQDILMSQCISGGLMAQTISGTVSGAFSNCNENATTNNAFLAVNMFIVSSDGTVVRGTLFSVYGTSTEFASASAVSRIFAYQSVTPLAIQQGDRLVVEIGCNAQAPTAAGSAGMSLTINLGNAGDLPLASGVAGSGSWIEFSQDIIPAPLTINRLRPRIFSPGIAR